MPLLKHLIGFCTALESKVQTQHAGPEDVHGSLNLLVDFPPTSISQAWSNGVLDFCKSQMPSVMVDNMNRAIKPSENHIKPSENPLEG